jgi:hypothetical protein
MMSRGRAGRLPPGVRHETPKPRISRQARRRQAQASLRHWQVPVAVAAVLLIGILVAIRLWLQAQPAQPDANALHTDITSGRSGAEVTFDATVVAPPVTAGDHEQIEVRDASGDQLELDYNTQLGQWIPLHVGDQVEVRGQLYIDSGRAGVHCLHSQTSSGCPEPGWVRFAGATYS